MSAPLRRAAGVAIVASLAIIGLCAGLVVGYSYQLPGQVPPAEVVEYPLPHHVPKYGGGISLRFAMVHDVLHERFPRHGEAYYQERNRLTRQALAQHTGPHDDSSLALFDDLGAGLDYLKQDEEAVSLLRDKLRAQEALGRKGRQLYTTYANLGTFLIHGNARAALSGDAAAKERLREGLSFIHKSIEVYPQAHFGREIWQAVAVEYLLAVSKNPQLLRLYDMVGDRITDAVDPSTRRSYTGNYGRGGSAEEVALYLQQTGEERVWRDPAFFRERYITPVVAEADWAEAVHSSHQKPVPFDEPTLGIIGMWRLGGGANPHFALALGEIMMRVGQRYIAWCAYERAAGMADRVWPDADIQRRFVEHCRRRQQVIEQQLPAEEVQQLRPRFEAELAYGRGYQKEYQDYEAQRIRAGTSLDDPHFYDDFNATHAPIASPVGEEEKFVAERHISYQYFNWPIAVFAAGVSACLAACVVRLAGGRTRRPEGGHSADQVP
jgi:hypothetical protein